MAGLRLELNPKPLEKGAADARRALRGVGAEAGRTERDLKDLERQERRTGAASAALAGKRHSLSEAFSGNSFAMRQMGLQLSQVGQQSMATGNFIQALAVQLPDIGLAFGTIGIAAGLLAGIALPILSKAFGGVVDSAAALEDNLSSLADSMDMLHAAERALEAPQDRLIKRYGEMSDQVRRLQQIQANVAEMQAKAAFGVAAGSLSSALGGVELKPGDYNRILAANNAMEAQVHIREQIRQLMISGAGALSDEIMQLRAEEAQMAQIEASAKPAAEAMQNLADAFGMSSDAALNMIGLLGDMNNAGNFQEQADAAIALANAIFDATDGLRTAKPEAIDLYNNLLAAAAQGAELAATDIASPIAAAADEAARLTANLSTYAGMQRGFDIQAYGAAQAEMRMAVLSGKINPIKPPNRGGGGGGRPAIDRTASDYERVRASIDAAWAAQSRYRKAVDALDAAYKSGLIKSQAEYNSLLGMAREKFLSASDAASDLGSVAETISNSMGDAMMSMVEGTKTVAESFRAMATDIVRELYRVIVVQRAVAAIKTVITNVIGGFAPAAPSFAGGGYTGSGPRSGGLDGQGGFLAVLHPRETVVDHTKARASGGGSPKIVINQTFTGGVTREDLGNAVPRIVEASKAAVLDAMRRHQGGF